MGREIVLQAPKRLGKTEVAQEQAMARTERNRKVPARRTVLIRDGKFVSPDSREELAKPH